MTKKFSWRLNSYTSIFVRGVNFDAKTISGDKNDKNNNNLGTKLTHWEVQIPLTKKKKRIKRFDYISKVA